MSTTTRSNGTENKVAGTCRRCTSESPSRGSAPTASSSSSDENGVLTLVCRAAVAGLGRHRAVDDTPAGGGPGMVIRADVLAAALDQAKAELDKLVQ